MFEPIQGKCFHCGADATFPCNWKNDWFICDECLDKIVVRFRRKQPAGLIIKSKKSLEYTTVWQPFKKMDLTLIKGTLEFMEQNEELAKTFNATKTACGGNFEYDEVKNLFRVIELDGEYSPVFEVSDVEDFYVQDQFQEYDNSLETAIDDDYYAVNNSFYQGSVLCIEFKNPYVKYVEFAFPNNHPAIALFRDKKGMRKTADDELSAILGRTTSDTRKLTKSPMASFEALLEGNPYTVSQNMFSSDDDDE